MGISGIVAEFNPLHNGHKYLIDRAKNDGNLVVCVISGNFVQRGDTAIVPKFVRAEMALNCGADMVVELPTPWAMSTAQNFAFGAISQLVALGIDTLYFGSESENLEELLKVSDILLSDEFNSKVSKGNSDGLTFAAYRSKIVSDMLGYNCDILTAPNDTLATEYICAAKKLGKNIKFVPVKRIGAGHNDLLSSNEFSNATLLRKEILNNNFEALARYMPKCCIQFLQNSPISCINRLDTSIISHLKLLNKDAFSNIPDVSEGVDNLLYNKLRAATSYSELLDELKTKRYTLARLRRIVLSAFLGINKKHFLTEPPYIRVLGFSNEAISKFSNCKKPLITRISQIKELDNCCKEIFDLEEKINEIYALSLNNPKAFINENFQKIIIK